MINAINLTTRFCGWLARHWVPLLVIFIAPGLVKPELLIPFASDAQREAAAATNFQVVAFSMAIAVSFAPGIFKKWHLSLATAIGAWQAAVSIPTSPAPAVEIFISALALGFAAIALYLPYGRLAARFQKDVADLTHKLSPSSGDEHGSARWATAGEAIAAFANGGVVLGSVRHFARDTLLRSDLKPGHVLVVAGSRAGKTSTFAIPTALSWPTSLVVLDPKGEIAAVTADARRAHGQKVFVLDHRDPGATAYVNIFDWLNPASPRFVEDVQNAAGWLYAERAKGEGGGGSDSGKFFQQTARTMLELAIARLFLFDENEATPRAVRAFVSQPIENLQKAVKALAIVEHSNALLRDYIRDLAGSLAGADAKTFANICVSTTADTKWLASPNLAAIVSGGPADATDAERRRRLETAQILSGNTTVYVCVAPDVLKTSPGFSRVLIGALLQQHYRESRNIAKDKVLYLLDEAPQLGDADVIEMTLRVGAGYNASLAYITQDLASLEQCFGKLGARAFLENCALKLMLGVSGDLETADWVSRMSGDATIVTSTASSSTQASASSGEQLIKRSLLTPREVLDLPANEGILFARSMRPIKTTKAFYKNIPEFARVAAPNPYDQA
ncbi:MAG: type IV secretory system conjugative DNA transfer family protein [Azospirillum sp.]|nr:type IV secretory system conjugative DNA transfer family protein [Azospirillum sp.]